MPYSTVADGNTPSTGLNEMLSAYQITQSIFVATSLGIPDVLGGGPKSCDELAQSTGAEPGALRRVLLSLIHI